MPPITLPQYNSVPDILGNFRDELWFGEVPGLESSPSLGAMGLTLKNVSITPPARTIGQVRVPLYNHPRAHRGHLDIGNQFTADFYEDVKGGTARTLIGWQNSAVDPITDDVGADGYVTDCELRVYDTTGRLANQFLLLNVWPMSVTLPASSSDAAGPAIISVQFSVDFFDPIAIELINMQNAR